MLKKNSSSPSSALGPRGSDGLKKYWEAERGRKEEERERTREGRVRVEEGAWSCRG